MSGTLRLPAFVPNWRRAVLIFAVISAVLMPYQLGAATMTPAQRENEIAEFRTMGHIVGAGMLIIAGAYALIDKKTIKAFLILVGGMFGMFAAILAVFDHRQTGKAFFHWGNKKVTYTGTAAFSLVFAAIVAFVVASSISN